MLTAVEVGTDIVPAGTLGLIVTLAGLFIRNMTQDRGAGFSLADEREQENMRLRLENQALREEIQEQRSLKHTALNQLAVDSGTLSLVRSLYDSCTCGALAPLSKLLDRRSDGRSEDHDH